MKKIEKEFAFYNTPKFNYQYKKEVNILGRKLIHIGEGIFMFERPFDSEEMSLDQLKKSLADYEDITLIRFYTYLRDETDYEKAKWITPFAISSTHKRHSAETIKNYFKKDMAGFHIPDSMKHIIDGMVENCHKEDTECYGFDEVNYNEPLYDRSDEDKGTHLLDFEHNEEDGKYVFVSGFVGRKILDGIYYFDDAVSLRGFRLNGPGENRLHIGGFNPYAFKEHIASLDKEDDWGFASYSFYRGNIYYMAFGDSAIDVLKRLNKNLHGYAMHIFTENVNTKDQVSAQPGSLADGYLESSSRTIQIPEGACELIEGMGFHDLEVGCTLLFQNMNPEDPECFADSKKFHKYEVSYILDEKLYLHNFSFLKNRVERHVLNLQMVKELSVKYKGRLFDGVEEDIVQVVFDKGEVEKEMIGEEDYGSYLKFISQEPSYF